MPLPATECCVGRATYIRFVVGTGRDDPYGLTGVITEARILRDQGELEPHECEWLDEVFEWFNASVPCPPFSQKQWSRDAVSWFKGVATGAIRTIWDLVALLREHKVPVRVLRTDQPGRILYEDDFQVVAESRHY
jgi:hypothetical protein